MATWNTKHRWHTTYSADSVEWCPVASYTHVMVCGTYQLAKEDEGQPIQKRLGKIFLFVIDEKTEELSPTQTLDTAGVLDQKWCYHTVQGHPILAVVTSEGAIALYRLLDQNGLTLILWTKVDLGPNTLTLSIDWSTNRTSSDEPKLVISDSLGTVTLWKVEGDSLQNICTWNSHGFEAWIAASNYWNSYVYYSGGDDCLFKSYDERLLEAVTTNRSHEAGVTAVRSHTDVEHQLLTGSYDEKVRLWDTRNLKREISEVNVGGGVWRLKWHPFNKNIVLAACMYGGFRLLRVDKDINIISEYLEHESIAYGADWRFYEESSMVATCSFYDCNLHISDVKFEHSKD